MASQTQYMTFHVNDARNRSLLLLLPGISGSSRQWDAVIERLADLPVDVAFGAAILASPAFGDTIPSISDVARGLAKDLHGANYDHVVIASHSVGSFVALDIAHQIPAHVSALILINGGLTTAARFLDRPWRGLFRQPIACLTFVRLFALVSVPAPARLRKAIANSRWFSRVMFGKFVSAAMLDTQQARSSLIAGPGQPAVLPSIWKNRHYWRKFAGYAQNIDADVLFVVGGKDPMSTERDTKLMASIVPGARVEVLHGIGHAAPLEAADAITAIVRLAFDVAWNAHPRGGVR